VFARSLIVLTLTAASLPAAAQSGGTAHLYAYRLKDRAAFENGYRRHLDWHARHEDKLVWYAWYVVAGERLNAFVDGTFGTSPEGLAARPDPQGDAADFRANAGPYAESIGDEGWDLWREVSRATPWEQHRPKPAVQVFALAVADGARFEAAVAARPIENASWYRASGSAPGNYLLIVPAAPSDTRPDLTRILGGEHPALLLARAMRSELWRYAPRLALLPGERVAP